MKFNKSKIYNSIWKSKPVIPDVSTLAILERPIIFELRGTNGSGKSTLPFMMQSLDPDSYIVTSDNSKFTVFPNFKTAVAGVYPEGRAVGGLDTVSSATNMEKLLSAMFEFSLQESIERMLFEGIMTSTSNTRWSKYITEVLGMPQGDCYVGWCNTPLDVCIQRIYSRTGTPFNEDGVKGKFEQLSRQPQKHAEEFPNMNRVAYDTMCTKEEMLLNWSGLSYSPILISPVAMNVVVP